MKELTQEQKNEAERLFMLRRRIYDAQNIKDDFHNCKEYEFSWFTAYDMDITGLSDQDIFALTVLSHDLKEYGTPSRAFKSAFDWDKNVVYRLAKNEPFIYSTTLFREDDGLIAGKGYVIDAQVLRECKRLYEEFLWHDSSEEIPSNISLLNLIVDVPDIYAGKINGRLYENVDKIILEWPMYAKDKDIPNWPKQENSPFKQRMIAVDRACVKKWKIVF